MPRDDDQSLGGEQTFAGKIERDDSPQSLGDQGTYAGGPGIRDPQSLGDEATFGDARRVKKLNRPQSSLIIM